jgi:hypothetical protein
MQRRLTLEKIGNGSSLSRNDGMISSKPRQRSLMLKLLVIVLGVAVLLFHGNSDSCTNRVTCTSLHYYYGHAATASSAFGGVAVHVQQTTKNSGKNDSFGLEISLPSEPPLPRTEQQNNSTNTIPLFDNTTDTTTDNIISSSSWRGYRPDRVISFIHVGKAGGMTVREATALACGPILENRSQACVEKRFPTTKKSSSNNETQQQHKHVLSLQTQHYFHLWGYRPDALNASTTFLVPLRSPLDRIVSSYRYSHPLNCKYAHPEQCKNNTRNYKPSWCCDVKKGHIRRPGVAAVYSTCFPSAAMEFFAQSSMSPYPTSPATEMVSTSLHHDERQEVVAVSPTADRKQSKMCRKSARDLLRGRSMAINHMHYNYEYYVKKAIERFPNREIFGIRTEHEWEDMLALDRAIGGDGNFPSRSMGHHSWGSEYYEPSPLSTQAVQKMCCLLEREIVYYFGIWDRVLNLSEESKQESKWKVREQCGLDNNTSWENWRQDCQRRVQADEEETTG